jgi:hypothetical protein
MLYFVFYGRIKNKIKFKRLGMPKNIDEISSEIISKVDELTSLVNIKDELLKRQDERSGPFVQSLNLVLYTLNTYYTYYPFYGIKKSAESNVLSINPKLLSLKELNKSKNLLLSRFFSDESLLQADDFPEFQRDAYRFVSIVRSILRPFDYIQSLITGYRILDHYFLLPKTSIELALDALDASIHEYNDALNVLKNDDKLKYKHPSKFEKDIWWSILSYLEPSEFIKITHDHALSRVFNVRGVLKDNILQQVNFEDDVFIYINPLLMLMGEMNHTYLDALKKVLDEGFHVSLFKIIDPERLRQTPMFDVPNMPESPDEGVVNEFNTKAWWRNASLNGRGFDYLSPEIFPQSCRAIRGRDLEGGPFISVLNSNNHVVTFFQRHPYNKLKWTTQGRQGLRELSTLDIGLNLDQKKEEIEGISLHLPDSGRDVHCSFMKYLEWKSLFLGYINALCPQEDGKPSDRNISDGICDSLKGITDDEYQLVDRTDYPELVF